MPPPQPQAQQQAPEGGSAFQPEFAPLIFEQFNGINTSTTRPGISDDQMAWCDGFFPIGPRQLRTLYDKGPYLWFAPNGTTIAFFDFANIGSTPYMIAVLSTGAVWAVNTNTSVPVPVAGPGAISNPSRQTVGITQYGSQYIILVSQQTNGYFIWDGTTFYVPGQSWPPGGTIPTGISGSAVEIYSGRVWVADGATINFSVAGSLVDFATGDGGGSFTSSDSFLRVQFTELIQTNGFLYLIGDSSINYISGVQTSGTPPTTTFTNQNADPEIGTIWPGTVDVLSRNIIFANAFGAHVSYGAAVTKISEPLDGVYNTANNFGGNIASAAKSIIFGKKVWILLLTIIDPITSQQVNKLFIWDSKKWFTSNQSVNLTFIQHQEINSVLTAYGTDGIFVYPLFTTPGSFLKTVQSRFWDRPVGIQETKAVNRIFGMAQYYSLADPILTINIDSETGSDENEINTGPATLQWLNDLSQTMTWTNSSSQTIEWFSTGLSIVILDPQAVGQQGVLLGLTISTQCEDMALISFMMPAVPVGYRG